MELLTIELTDLSTKNTDLIESLFLMEQITKRFFLKCIKFHAGNQPF